MSNQKSQLLRAKLGDSPCSILSHPDLEGKAKINASSYVDTNRIKAFGEDKCYINYDVYNDSRDYLVKSCDKQNFRNAPFIKNATIDKNETGKNQVPIQKCVLEIDRNQVNKDTLQTFWDSIDESECLKINGSILETNSYLKTKHNEIKASFEKLTSIKKTNEATLKTHADRVTQLTSSLQKEQADVKKNLDLESENLKKLTEYQASQKEKTTKSLEETARSLRKLEDLAVSRRKKESDLRLKENDLALLHQNSIKNFDLLQNTYNDLVAKFRAENTNRKELQDKHDSIRDKKLVCDNKTIACMNDTNLLNIDFKDFQSVKESLQKEVLDKYSEFVSEPENDIATLINKLNKDLVECLKTRQALLIAIDLRQKEMNEISKIPEGNCDNLKRQYEDLLKEREKLDKQCELYRLLNKKQNDNIAKMESDTKRNIIKRQRCQGNSEMQAVLQSISPYLEYEKQYNNLVLNHKFANNIDNNYVTRWDVINYSINSKESQIDLGDGRDLTQDWAKQVARDYKINPIL